jgi:Lactonase, 7-bladed beta-propeller
MTRRGLRRIDRHTPVPTIDSPHSASSGDQGRSLLVCEESLMLDNIEKTGRSRFEIDASGDPLQNIPRPSKSDRFEGVAFSSSGNVVGVASTETVILYRRNANGLFEDTPYWSIGGLNYPHDVSFSRWRDTELLAVAQRTGSIEIYEKNPADETYSPEPVFRIYGAKSRLDYSDGVAFVPPHNEYIAACSLTLGNITFYRRDSRSPIGFELIPVFVLDHPSLIKPDGLAFSRCGRWIAVANHGDHSVSIFQGANRVLSGEKLIYGPAPVTIIKDPRLRYAHSVAFTPKTNHLVVTNAGANYFCVYEPITHQYGLRWSQSPVLQKAFGPDHIFRQVQASENEQEGGPKGVAAHANSLAVCSPELGVKIYTFREHLEVDQQSDGVFMQ